MDRTRPAPPVNKMSSQFLVTAAQTCDCGTLEATVWVASQDVPSSTYSSLPVEAFVQGTDCHCLSLFSLFSARLDHTCDFFKMNNKFNNDLLVLNKVSRFM